MMKTIGEKMEKEEVIATLNSIKDYLCARNPIYDTERVRTAIEVAVKSLETNDYGTCCGGS